MTAAPLPRLALAALLLTGSAVPAGAETLQEALAAAYRDNPTLTAARAGLRATDESVNIQRANERPALSLTGSYGENALTRPFTAFSADRSLSASVTASVPIYQGGRVRAGIEGAKRRVEAGQFDLRGIELEVFAAVVGAYMDVIRAESVVSLSSNNVQVLEVNLRATRDRFEVGDLTRTDVAQSEARLSLARADLKNSEAQLIAARERYIELVGHEPVDLQPPPPLPGLPSTPDDAVDIALANNPDLAAARKAREASAYDVRAAEGQKLPTLSAFSTGNYNGDLGSTPAGNQPDTRSVVVGARLTLPLYQGGGPASRVRQSKAYEQQAMERETAVERNIVSQTRSLYSSWQASRQVIESTRVAVSSNALSLQGVRAENSVGTRTILDILNAEQESFSAQVQLVTAQRNAYVAGFSLLAAMGRVSATDLGIAPDDLYDPQDNYRRVRNDWSDWNEGAAPAPQASRTVDSPTQNATVSDPVTNIGAP
ncbi:MAG TPA: TolC family outer membrane protein [Sphingobium sp.]|nr:TolC family outer membrane protein [Sphingobium sp.]